MKLETLWRLLIGTLFVLPAAGGAEEPPSRTVAVSGSGEASVEPDRALVQMTVELRNADLQVARREVNRIVDAFLKVSDELGVPRQQVSSTGTNVRPEYEWNNATQQRRLTGYYVSRQIQVDLRELDKLGPLIERSTAAGVSQVSPPQLGSSREAAVRREALAKAAEDARLNAETIAGTLGARIGQVRRISSSDVVLQPPPVRPMMELRAAGAAAASGEASYETGQIKFNASVTAEFDLIVP